MRDNLVDIVAEALQVGLTIADLDAPDAPVMLVNDTFTALTGYQRQEVLGRNLRFLHGPETDASTVARVREAVRRRERITVEILNYRKDGSKFWNLLSIAPMPDAMGRPSRLVGVQRDVSEVKARQLAEASTQRQAALGLLAGGIAHDFNNLLSAVIGNCELLAGEIRDRPQAAGPLQAIEVAAQRGASHVRRLMTLTKAPILAILPIDLRAVCDEVALLLRGSLSPAVRLHVDLAPEARWVWGDVAQLEDALLNLALNARDAMPGGGNIEIRTECRSDAGQDWVIVSVKDDGSGMDEQTMSRVFDPFFTRRAVGSGHGLGLSMVHSYVRGVGGRIQVQSTLGKGSCFIMSFRAASTEAARVASADAHQDASPVQRNAHRRTLVVEDDDVLRLTTARMLEQLGFEVEACADAGTALTQLSSGRDFDLLLTDHLLGGAMNGVQLATQALQLQRGLAVVICSGWTESPLEGGPDVAFLAKPFTTKTLNRALTLATSAVASRHSGRSARAAPGR